MENNAVAIRETNALAQPGELSVEQVLAQVEKIQILMQKGMNENEHFGKIPGTPKPTLLKPGAEKLCLMFRLDPEYEVTNERDGVHLTITSRCTLYHISSGVRMGSGMGSCSTRESKYAYRKADRICPRCEQPTVFKSKPPQVGYYCWSKKGGCGAQFKLPVEIQEIDKQDTGRVANPDIADQYNTVLKMANKRSLVAAVLNVTAASDIFTQDLEDVSEARREMGEGEDKGTPPRNLSNPNEKASPEQRKALAAAAAKQLSDKSTEWLKAKFKELGYKSRDDLTIGGFTRLMKELAEMPDPARGEEPQDDGSEAIAADFDRESRQER